MSHLQNRAAAPSLFCLLALALSSPVAAAPAVVKVDGSSTVYPITEAVAEAITTHTDAGHADIVDVGGVGGTLAGNALSTAAMRATSVTSPTTQATACPANSCSML